MFRRRRQLQLNINVFDKSEKKWKPRYNVRIKSRSDERFDNLNIEYQKNNIMKELKQPWFFQNHSLNIIAD